jgi:transcriptional regulator with XRE-family HTH domain
MSTLTKNLGENIRTLRKAKKMTQAALAQQCGLHRSYICDIENALRNPGINSLSKIAQALGTTVSALAAC